MSNLKKRLQEIKKKIKQEQVPNILQDKQRLMEIILEKGFQGNTLGFLQEISFSIGTSDFLEIMERIINSRNLSSNKEVQDLLNKIRK